MQRPDLEYEDSEAGDEPAGAGAAEAEAAEAEGGEAAASAAREASLPQCLALLRGPSDERRRVVQVGAESGRVAPAEAPEQAGHLRPLRFRGFAAPRDEPFHLGERRP